MTNDARATRALATLTAAGLELQASWSRTLPGPHMGGARRKLGLVAASALRRSAVAGLPNSEERTPADAWVFHAALLAGSAPCTRARPAAGTPAQPHRKAPTQWLLLPCPLALPRSALASTASAAWPPRGSRRDALRGRGARGRERELQPGAARGLPRAPRSRGARPVLPAPLPLSGSSPSLLPGVRGACASKVLLSRRNADRDLTGREQGAL